MATRQAFLKLPFLHEAFYNKPKTCYNSLSMFKGTTLGRRPNGFKCPCSPMPHRRTGCRGVQHFCRQIGMLCCKQGFWYFRDLDVKTFP